MEVQVLQRTMDILETIGNSQFPISLKNIAEATKLPKSTVYRLLSNLENRQYVHCSSDGTYRLGIKLLMLTQKVDHSRELRSMARQYILRLNELTRETVHLAVLDRNRVLYVDTVESPQTIRLVARVGSTNALHCTALGKALLVQHTDEQILNLIGRQPLERHTEFTIVEPEVFLRHMTQVRRQGFAMDERESEAEARCVGAPIFGYCGQVMGAISISGPATRVTRNMVVDHFVPALFAAAKELSNSLGLISNEKGNSN